MAGAKLVAKLPATRTHARPRGLSTHASLDARASVTPRGCSSRSTPPQRESPPASRPLAQRSPLPKLSTAQPTGNGEGNREDKEEEEKEERLVAKGLTCKNSYIHTIVYHFRVQPREHFGSSISTSRFDLLIDQTPVILDCDEKLRIYPTF